MPPFHAKNPINPSTARQIDDSAHILSRARGIVDVEILGLEAVKNNLGQPFVAAVQMLEACEGRVIVTGMGKSGIIGKKIAATFSSTGTPSYFLHPAEGSHGDLGSLMKHDVVLAISNSGETPEILEILPLIKRFGVPLIAMTGKVDSTLAQHSDIVLNSQVPQEACPMGLAPTASTTATLALGDALAVVLLERRGFSEADFALFHPSGNLGKRLLLTVRELMHAAEALPVVPLDGTGFMDALLEVSQKKLGVAILINSAGIMAGVLTDGDIRRALTRFSDPRKIPLAEVMTVSPKTIAAGELAVKALQLMETHQITVLLITDSEGRPEGVIHLHDLLKAGLA